MTGDGLLRALRRVARARGLELVVRPGRGDHLKVWLGDRMTVLPGRRQELRLGTYLAILRQLGVSRDEVEE